MRLYDPSPEEETAWNQWVSERPEAVRRIAERFDMWSLYLLKTTDQRVTIYSYSEDGTVTVDITGEHNLILFDRQVFGINPDELEPCDLPSTPVGTILSPEAVDENIDAIRVMTRPDLFIMDENGKAIRKDN